MFVDPDGRRPRSPSPVEFARDLEDFESAQNRLLPAKEELEKIKLVIEELADDPLSLGASGGFHFAALATRRGELEARIAAEERALARQLDQLQESLDFFGEVNAVIESSDGPESAAQSLVEFLDEKRELSQLEAVRKAGLFLDV
ncbi:MAG: hypothetical protein AAF657_35065 [Acidobacteriota bacterium]